MVVIVRGAYTGRSLVVVVMSDTSETAAGVDDRQVALQSVTMIVNPVNVSEGDWTVNNFGVSPNTSSTEVT